MKITRTLLELLKIESFTGKEEQIASEIRKIVSGNCCFELYEFGLTQVYHTKIDPQKTTLAFYGHMDTVINQQDCPPFSDEEFIYGCGAADMKGGLAVMIELIRNLNPEKLKYNLQFIFYDREEGPYSENGLYVALPKVDVVKEADFAFVLEPTNNRVQVGCLGVINQLVKIQGKSAHSARPWEGENAVHKAWKLLKKLDETEPKLHLAGGFEFYEVCSATLTEGGKQRNAIPETFTVNLNYRFPPGWSVETAMENLKTKFFDENVKFLNFDTSPSGKVCSEHPVLKRMIERFNLKIEAKQAWTDIAQLVEHGIPAVNFGPGNPAEAHQANEKISIHNLIRNYEIFSAFLYESEM